MIRSIDEKSLMLDAEDERTITFQITDKTTKPAKLVPGDKVAVDATQDDKGLFLAVAVTKTGHTSPPVAMDTPMPAAAATTNEPADDGRPTTAMATPITLTEDEGGPPKLKRGMPPPRKKTAEEEPQPELNAPQVSEVHAGAQPAASSGSLASAGAEHKSIPVIPGRMALVDKARDASAEFLTGLPNYVCQQFTTRYVSEGQKHDWHALDVVSADLVYEDGKEHYDHLAINGHAVKQKIEETGSWSYGEFGTVLSDVFSPATGAAFKFVADRNIQRQSASVFDFAVPHERSHWNVKVPGQMIYPAYKGSMWIAKESGRVLRLEMQAVKVPEEFPYDKVEMAVDYDWVSLETSKYLLPVKAEMLSCERGSNTCQRNVIEFRNYHRFAGDSTITFH